jgi:hypothetical protein
MPHWPTKNDIINHILFIIIIIPILCIITKYLNLRIIPITTTII